MTSILISGFNNIFDLTPPTGGHAQRRDRRKSHFYSLCVDDLIIVFERETGQRIANVNNDMYEEETLW